MARWRAAIYCSLAVGTLAYAAVVYAFFSRPPAEEWTREVYEEWRRQRMIHELPYLWQYKDTITVPLYDPG